MEPGADPIYALSLFDIADNDDYRAYSRQSRQAVASPGGRVVALGQQSDAFEKLADLRPLFTIP
jgi:uncharacterized protein (DUF1330 family)